MLVLRICCKSAILGFAAKGTLATIYTWKHWDNNDHNKVPIPIYDSTCGLIKYTNSKFDYIYTSAIFGCMEGLLWPISIYYLLKTYWEGHPVDLFPIISIFLTSVSRNLSFYFYSKIIQDIPIT